MDKHDLKKIGIGALVGILIALVIVFGIEAFSNKQTEQVATSSEPAVTSSAPEKTPDTTNTTEATASSTSSDITATDNQNTNQNSSNMYDSDSRYVYVGENDQEKWYVDKYSCKLEEEDEHSILYSFELSRAFKNSNESIANTCYLGGYDGNRSFKYGSDGQWESLARTKNPLYKKVNDTVMQILKEQYNS